MYSLTALTTDNAVFSRCFFSTLFLSSLICTSISVRAVHTYMYMLPVFFYTFFTRVHNTPFFTETDISLFSKRFFTFYSTALLAYKRNSEMYSSDMRLNIQQIKHHIRENVTHNSVRSLRIGSVTQSRLFKRIAYVFQRKSTKKSI
jgi:hypothetical protein